MFKRNAYPNFHKKQLSSEQSKLGVNGRYWRVISSICIIVAFLGTSLFLSLIWGLFHFYDHDEIFRNCSACFAFPPLCGFLAAISIILGTSEIKKTFGIIQIIIVVLMVIFFAHIAISITRAEQYDIYRISRAWDESGSLVIAGLGEDILDYAKDHTGNLPDSDKWCDILVDQYDKWVFDFTVTRIYKTPTFTCFAYNKNISGMNLADIPDNVVLLFEADGPANNSGGEELLYSNRAKDKYYRKKNDPKANRVFWKGGFIPVTNRFIRLFTHLTKPNYYIYIFFVDGKVGKYYFYNQQVEIADPKTDVITYRQLRWEP